MTASLHRSMEIKACSEKRARAKRWRLDNFTFQVHLLQQRHALIYPDSSKSMMKKISFEIILTINPCPREMRNRLTFITPPVIELSHKQVKPQVTCTKIVNLSCHLDLINGDKINFPSGLLLNLRKIFFFYLTRK